MLSAPSSLSISGHYVYLVSGQTNIIDVAIPTQPKLVSTFNTPNGPALGTIEAVGDYLYSALNNEFVVFNISDPSNPQAIAEVSYQPIDSTPFRIGLSDNCAFFRGNIIQLW